MPRPVLPKRCELCGDKCVKQASGYWLCMPPEGCGWSDDPGTVQPQATTLQPMPTLQPTAATSRLHGLRASVRSV